MATGPRKLSFAKLINALDIDKARADFIDVHTGNEANLSALFDSIESLKEKSPGDYSRLYDVIRDVNENGTPDQLTEALADAIYGREQAEPEKKTGIRGKTDAPPERIESVGAATDKADKGALPDTPPAAEEKPKRGRGRPRKTPPATETPAAETPAPSPANPNAPMDVGFTGQADMYTGMPAAPNFSIDTSPAAMQAADPMGLGVDRMLLQQYMQQPPAGAFASAVNNAPAATGMPQVADMPTPPAGPPPRTDITQLDMSAFEPRGDISKIDYSGVFEPAPAMPSGVGRPTEPPSGMSIDEQIAALEALSPQFSAPQSAPLSGLLDAVEAPQGAGTLPGVSLSPENDPTNFYNYPPPQGGGGGGGPPNDPPKTMIGALRDMIARNPKKTALGAAALGGYAYFNQPQPNPNAPTEEEAMGDDAALQKAMDELRTIQGPPLPVGLPPRR